MSELSPCPARIAGAETLNEVAAKRSLKMKGDDDDDDDDVPDTADTSPSI